LNNVLTKLKVFRALLLFTKSSRLTRYGSVGFINAGNPTAAGESNAISFLQLDGSGNILPVSSIGILLEIRNP